MPAKQAEILDLDILVPPKRIIKVTEKGPSRGFRAVLSRLGLAKSGRVREIDLSAVPTATTLQIERLVSRIDQLGRANADAQEIEDAMFSLMALACQSSAPDITPEWIKANLLPAQIEEMFRFIIKPMQDRYEKLAAEMAGKNASAPQQ